MGAKTQHHSKFIETGDGEGNSLSTALEYLQEREVLLE
jgi:hypothetical protein